MIGLSPKDIDALSLWQFSAVVAKYNEAHNTAKKGAAEPADLSEISSALDSKPLIIRKK